MGSELERRHSERALLDADLRLVARAKLQWESTVDALPDLVFLVAPDRRVIRANRTIETWGLGSVRNVEGRDLHATLHADCRDPSCQILELWDRFMDAGNGTQSLECDYRDGLLNRRIDLSMHRSGRRSADATTTVVVRDCSEIYERGEVRRRRDRLETMEYVLGGLAHEVGNPIAAMKTTLDVWRRSFDRFDRDTHERFLMRVEEGLDRLRASVDRVLARSREIPPKSEPVCIRALLERVHSLFVDQAAEAGIRFSAQTSLGADEAVLGDPTAIDEILTNVAKNALEASSRGDTVQVRAGLRGDDAILLVEDSGSGISAEDMERLFVPFFTRKPTGTGLGLTLANQLMGQMGGRIQIESSEGAGTVVTLQLPRARRAARVNSS